MSLQKTAMQELKWFISDGLDNYDESIKVSEIWNKLDELLEKEKKQIIDAVEETIMDMNLYEHFRTLKSGEQYYNETFKK